MQKTTAENSDLIRLFMFYATKAATRICGMQDRFITQLDIDTVKYPHNANKTFNLFAISFLPLLFLKFSIIL